MSDILNLNTIGDRIRCIRKEFAITQSAFAESLGISQGHLSEIECNKTSPSQPLLIAIEYLYSINKDWLYRGKDPKYRKGGEPILKNRNLTSYLKDPDLIEIIQILQEIPEAKEAILKLLRGRKETLEALAMLQYPPE